MFCPSRRKATSHRMVSERAGDRQIRAEIDADQERAGDVRREVSGADGGAGNEAERQIIHRIAGNGGAAADGQGGHLRLRV